MVDGFCQVDRVSSKILNVMVSLPLFEINFRNISITTTVEAFPYFFGVSAAIAVMFPFYAYQGLKQETSAHVLSYAG